MEINSAIDVSDEAVEAMIAESFDHAFEDMNERVWIETELKAKEMLNAVAIAFERVGDEIDPAEKETILQAVAQVKEILKTRDTRRLQVANADLDKTTQGLAASVVEKAIRDAAIKASA